MSPDPRKFTIPFVLVLASLGATLANITFGDETKKPNVEFIMADDLGWSDVGFNGSDAYLTPHVDKLAHQGMSFTDFYAAGPACSPARTANMTGKYPARIGAHFEGDVWDAGNLKKSGDEKKPFGHMTIVTFGDSTTARRRTVKQVYADRLPVLLREQGFYVKVINAGVGGSHTGRLSDNARHRRKHALDRFGTAVRDQKPDVVVVQFGWNDSWIDSGKPDGDSRIPVDDYAANLKHIADTLKKDGAKVILMTPNRPNTSVEKWRVARTQQYVDVVRNLATQGSFTLVDVWAEYDRFNAADNQSSDDLLLDSLHPNDKGHELVASLLADSIVSLDSPTRKIDDRVEIDLFHDGMNGAANYRIPSLTVTTKGTLLAVCDCRRERGGDAPNNIDQVIRRSADNGKTWSAVRTIVDFFGKRAAADPSLVVDQKTGTIWLSYVYANEGVGLAGGRNEPGYGDDTFHIHLRRSDDDGLTWSKPMDVTRQIKPPEWVAIWTAPGIGIQTRDGRLMICFSGRKRGPDQKWVSTSNIAYSDDHGKTWQSFKEIGLGTNESQVAELADGSYMINMRQNGGRSRWVSISKDRGQTWSKQKQHSTLIEPSGCQASFLRLTSKSKGNSRNRLLFCNPASTVGRKNLTVRLSYDEGKTWPVERAICAGPSAYSCMTVLPDGSIGLLYERDGRRITFTRFTVEWLLDGKEKREQTRN